MNPATGSGEGWGRPGHFSKVNSWAGWWRGSHLDEPGEDEEELVPGEGLPDAVPLPWAAGREEDHLCRRAGTSRGGGVARWSRESVQGGRCWGRPSGRGPS